MYLLVSTISHLLLIIKYHARWYKCLGIHTTIISKIFLCILQASCYWISLFNYTCRVWQVRDQPLTLTWGHQLTQQPARTTDPSRIFWRGSLSSVFRTQVEWKSPGNMSSDYFATWELILWSLSCCKYHMKRWELTSNMGAHYIVLMNNMEIHEQYGSSFCSAWAAANTIWKGERSGAT